MKLEVANLGKQYATPGGILTILSNVHFSLAPGDAAAIMGPSGTGKSTLLYILGGLETPSSGTVLLGGRNIFELDPVRLASFRNSEIGFVFQDHCLLPQCSVLENVLLPTLVAPSKESVMNAKSLIADVGLFGEDRSQTRTTFRGRKAESRHRASPHSTPTPSGLRRTNWQPGRNHCRFRSIPAPGPSSQTEQYPDRRDTQLTVGGSLPSPVRAVEHAPGAARLMTIARLVFQSMKYYWRTNPAVLLGVAVAVAVLSGALLVGDSVRGSLRAMVLERLGRTDQVVLSSGFLGEQLVEKLQKDPESQNYGIAPLIIAQGFVTRAGQRRTRRQSPRLWSGRSLLEFSWRLCRCSCGP